MAGTELLSDKTIRAALKAVAESGKARKLNEIAKARGQSLSQMALAWALRGGRVTSVLVGAKIVAHVEDNVKALSNLAFAPEELENIEAILA